MLIVTFLYCLLSITFGVVSGWAQSGHLAKLIEGAQKEGQLVLYTGIFESDANPLISRFEQKYPFIKVTHYRAGGVPLVSRIQNERRAGSSLWDIFNSAGLE
jgi:iron(III) transport system substrate-binding protein